MKRNPGWTRRLRRQTKQMSSSNLDNAIGKVLANEKKSDERDVRYASAGQQQDFPYERDEEAQVTRREFCNFLAITSTALFFSAGGFAGKYLLEASSTENLPQLKIDLAANLKAGESLNFRYPTDRATRATRCSAPRRPRLARVGQPAVSAPFVLPIDQPLDLTNTLAGGQCFRWRQDDHGRWHGVIGQDIVRLSMADGGLVIESSPTPPAEIAESIASYLRLDDDLAAIHERLGRDGRVREGIEHYPGLRIMRQEPWETLAGFILSSTSNIPRISGIMASLADTFGTPVSLDDVERTTFASPQALAEAGGVMPTMLACQAYLVFAEWARPLKAFIQPRRKSICQ